MIEFAAIANAMFAGSAANCSVIAGILTPSILTGWQHMLMLVPLCLGISIVYKTLKCEDLKEVPAASVVLCAAIVGSMFAVGIGIWVLYGLMA
ncbi:MAG TPA: hypothetical protein PKN33_16285 [Phycisphaerae bacterium]|nr:hypothetical protein [Phycisphaerales bacterium]HNO79609.1 hypothetical protein [Phycisphaerae bacterium]